MILASSSSRRRALLKQIGVNFDVYSPNIDETPLADESPIGYVERMALTKARAVLEVYPAQVVLGADTIGVLEGDILVKPINTLDAERMLNALSGKTHEVTTAVAILSQEQEKWLHVTTKVSFRHLAAEEIRQYVATGEPMDKAGSYAIQGLGAVFVEKIVGSYANVVGLPLTETASLLKEFSVPVWQCGK